MTFIAFNWLSISINLLLVVFVIVCLLMTLLIMMQRPKQEGLGAAFGAGVTDQVFGARTTNVLQRGTIILGSLFFILSLTLSVLISHKDKPVTLKAPVKAAPAAPTPPKSLSEELPPAQPVPDISTAPAPAEVPADAPAPADAAGEPAPQPTEAAPQAVPTEPAPVPTPEIPAEKPE